MKEKEVTSVCDLIGVLKEWKGKQSIFRGLKSADHKLLPAIGRCPLSDGTKRSSMESRLFRRFKERSLAHLKFSPRDDWEWLAVAQHFGLPTRLLDWSTNPLVGAYFAVEHEWTGDSAIYVCEVNAVLCKRKDPDPFKLKTVLRFQPPAITERSVLQSGLFTVHCHVEEDFAPDNMWKLVVPETNRREMKKELFKLGFSRGVLFPGLDGIAADLTWEGSGRY